MDYPVSDEFAKLHNGKFTDGDPQNNIPPSKNSATNINTLYDELLATLSSAGITPDENNTTQLAQAVAQLITNATADSQRRAQYTAQVTGSSYVEFVIPSWARVVTLDFTDLSLDNSGDYPLLYLGTSAGIETNGYAAYKLEFFEDLNGNAIANEELGTEPKLVRQNLYDSESVSGSARLALVDPGSAAWVMNAQMFMRGEGEAGSMHYNKSLADALAVVRLQANTGIFDSGYVGVSIEGL